jgi:hypothetical protein
MPPSATKEHPIAADIRQLPAPRLGSGATHGAIGVNKQSSTFEVVVRGPEKEHDEDVLRVEVGQYRGPGLLTDLVTADRDCGGRPWTNQAVERGS